MIVYKFVRLIFFFFIYIWVLLEEIDNLSLGKDGVYVIEIGVFGILFVWIFLLSLLFFIVLMLLFVFGFIVVFFFIFKIVKIKKCKYIWFNWSVLKKY